LESGGNFQRIVPLLDILPTASSQVGEFTFTYSQPDLEDVVKGLSRRVNDGQVLTHLGWKKGEILFSDIADDGLAHRHALNGQTAIPSDEKLVNEEIRGLVELAGRAVRQTLDQDELKIKPVVLLQTPYRLDNVARALHASVGWGVQHSEPLGQV